MMLEKFSNFERLFLLFGIVCLSTSAYLSTIEPGAILSSVLLVMSVPPIIISFIIILTRNVENHEHLVESPATEVDIKLAMDTKFSEGHGVLQINPNITDEEIALAVRSALKSANGQPFKIVPTMSAAVTN